jgi:hypothetical protein
VEGWSPFLNATSVGMWSPTAYGYCCGFGASLVSWHRDGSPELAPTLGLPDLTARLARLILR